MLLDNFDFSMADNMAGVLFGSVERKNLNTKVDSKATGVCGYGVSCAGGGGSCGISVGCSGGGGRCGYGIGCSGGGGRCGISMGCSGR